MSQLKSITFNLSSGKIGEKNKKSLNLGQRTPYLGFCGLKSAKPNVIFEIRSLEFA